MKTNSIIMTVILLATLLVSGCTTPGDLFTEKNYQKEFVGNRHAYFSQVWAMQDNGKFFVKGKIKRRASCGIVPKIVQVELISPDGTVQSVRKVNYIPRIMRNKSRRRTARFTAEFSNVPPTGTIVRLAVTD